MTYIIYTIKTIPFIFSKNKKCNHLVTYFIPQFVSFEQKFFPIDKTQHIFVEPGMFLKFLILCARDLK